MLMNDTLTAVPGLRVGHYTDLEHATGCTVVLCPPGTVGGVDVRGGAPGTRETDLLRSENYVEEVNAVFLSGGSAYGLAVGSGVMRYLEAQGQGYRSARGFVVPIVPGAILMDLGVGSSVRPDENSGYAACEAATDAPSLRAASGQAQAPSAARSGARTLPQRAGSAARLLTLEMA
jgi:L-aminopeptidase/D-esterase-like protein